MDDKNKKIVIKKLRDILNSTNISLNDKLLELKDDLNNNKPIDDSIVCLTAVLFLIWNGGKI